MPPQGPRTWIRLVAAAAAAHGIYRACFVADSVDARSLWLAVSAGLLGAVSDPVRYWPAVLAALVAYVAPPVWSAWMGQSRPTRQTLTDAIWWAPLSLVLLSAYTSRLRTLRARVPDVLDLALRAQTNRGVSLTTLSRSRPVLVVFLRHAGCTFCREALADLSEQRPDIEALGTTIVLAHMGEPDLGERLFRKYGLDDLHQISDPRRSVYRGFGLSQGNLWMVFGPKVWVRGFDAGILRRHGVGLLAGDGFQMPGIFMVFHGQIVRSYRHQSVADRPNYVRFVSEDAITGMIT